ncbi:hypothetical protein [Pseudomonas panipatensis]|uniref:Uncharacterized protein n=1 Tax=Pseudomonas panipatensis TaxID=428992 RepID=A0A1G8HJ29_9PSED|nr:hypothetical protein [Pseudomonas panipatensis]SDI06572.1 hypothetical protein SAMN05216272_105259 [Pseudomonas panipatensis]SMP58524.1 hypothetical protein SAMN06295951_104260 [Pseudomonas panipatensis]
MTLTAHVPASANPSAPQPANPSPFYTLGARLMDLGTALQNERSTINDLVRLAGACGMDLRIKVVECSEVRHENAQRKNVARHDQG